VSSKPDLVAQLYRVDWTRLSLAATITWRQDRALSQQLWQRRMDQRWPLSPARPPIRWSIDDDPDVAADDAIERRILVAPGARYRVLADDNLTTVCDASTDGTSTATRQIAARPGYRRAPRSAGCLRHGG